ncbi:Dihydropyrimidinase- protein 5 [Ameca splendens]|uniref:Dihydropyrimidinase- protein 5 n=1 Tax=Ameca splendens TaxID=208324 RepID=A0ABV0YT28_9TELE
MITQSLQCPAAAICFGSALIPTHSHLSVGQDRDGEMVTAASTFRIMAANMGSMRILIKGGKVVNDDFTHEADVYIENGIIQQVGKELMIPGGAKVIDASGKLVLPGGIDTCVHLQQTFMNASIQDDFYSGTKVEEMKGGGER